MYGSVLLPVDKREWIVGCNCLLGKPFASSFLAQFIEFFVEISRLTKISGVIIYMFGIVQLVDSVEQVTTQSLRV